MGLILSVFRKTVDGKDPLEKDFPEMNPKPKTKDRHDMVELKQGAFCVFYLVFSWYRDKRSLRSLTIVGVACFDTA